MRKTLVLLVLLTLAGCSIPPSTGNTQVLSSPTKTAHPIKITPSVTHTAESTPTSKPTITPMPLIWDIDADAIPQFVQHDFTQLEKISQISKFRSGVGHDFSDGSDFSSSDETCRSMKHYFAPYNTYKTNNEIEVYSPVDGVIINVSDENHGANLGLTNKQIQIRSREYPAFSFVIFHVDLVSDNIVIEKDVFAGELLGYARMNYEDLNEIAHDFDIAVMMKTPYGNRYVSYFEVMSEKFFNSYFLRGIDKQQNLIITRSERDANPLVCSGMQFVRNGGAENWVTLVKIK